MNYRKEIDSDKLDQVNGGCYINVTMTIEQIIETDHNLANILVQSGLSSFGNRGVKGMSLYEVAQSKGIDPYMLEDIMNDYLSAK